MSYHVYLARPGFTEDPIDQAHWLQVARDSAHLQVRDVTLADGAVRQQVTLAADPARRLWWSSGVVVANDPTRELMEALFALAGPMGAGVYSEGRNPYRSVDDWAERAKRYVTRDKARRAWRARRLRKVVTQALVWGMVLAGVGLGLRLVR